MVKKQRQAHRSLRTILMVWFLLFSVVPLAFVTGYSVIKYERAIDNELSLRLSGNAREVAAILEDFRTGLLQKRNRYLKDNSLLYNMSTSDASAVRSLGINWLKSDFASSLTFFNRDGKMLVSVFKDAEGMVRDFFPRGSGAVFLSDENLEKLKNVKEY